ncbi:MAG: hypothetical protein AB1413_01815 [Thermodesulfobacteriota bacterium]|jgi:hypothetical protein
MQTICCICHRTKSDNRWIRSAQSRAKKVSHGYCPSCYRQLMEQVHSYFANRLLQADS